MVRRNLMGKNFRPGERVQGPITVAARTRGFDVVVERVEPEESLSFRWHPYAIDRAIDYSKEERTLVTFELKERRKGPCSR